jgi:hypothetical protein
MTGLFGGTLLFVLLGVAPETDVVAHLGGFVCGFALGILMSRSTRQLQRPFFNILGLLCFLALFMWPWWLAIRHTSH